MDQAIQIQTTVEMKVAYSNLRTIIQQQHYVKEEKVQPRIRLKFGIFCHSAAHRLQPWQKRIVFNADDDSHNI